MNTKSDKDRFFSPEDLRAFLLGGLPQREMDLMEEKLITSDTFFREVQAAEEELIDEYALGTLTAVEAQHLLQRCERQAEWPQRLALRKAFFAAMHRRTVRQTEQPPSHRPSEVPISSRRFRFLIPGLAAVASLLLVICALLLQEAHELKVSLAQAGQARTAASPIGQPAPAAASSVTEIFFPLHVVRGIGPHAALRLGRTPQRPVELQVQIPPGLPNTELWNVTIRDKHGNLIVQNGRRAHLVGSIAFVKLSLSSTTLAPGTYDAQLSPARPATEAHTNHWLLQVEP